jgi:hypothetical protein
MLKKVLNLELSSGGFSAPAPGVEARDAVFEGAAEFVAEPGRALSAARSAMVSVLVACSGGFRCLYKATSNWDQRVGGDVCGGANALQVMSRLACA